MRYLWLVLFLAAACSPATTYRQMAFRHAAKSFCAIYDERLQRVLNPEPRIVIYETTGLGCGDAGKMSAVIETWKKNMEE